MYFKDSTAALSAHYQGIEEYRGDFRNLNLFRLIKKEIRGQKVLDAGCGGGNFLHFLKKNLEKSGLEPNQDLVVNAQKANPKATIKQGFAEEINTLFQERFNSIVMLDVLEHVEGDTKVLELLMDRLEKDGRLIIVVPAYQYLFGIRDKAVGHYRRYSGKALRKVLKESGYEVEKLRYWNVLGLLPYWISEKVFKKPLETKLRSNKDLGLISSLINKAPHLWFRILENNINLGFGLSILCIAKVRKD